MPSLLQSTSATKDFARYVHPKKAGLLVSSEPGNARILPSSYDRIEELRNFDEVLVIPGFFRRNRGQSNLHLLPRWLWHYWLRIIAAGVKADFCMRTLLIDGIFAAHPGIIHKPHSIPGVNLSGNAGIGLCCFSVLHDEALLPAYRGRIPLVIKNTNNPSHPGTRIVLKHSGETLPVVGIAADDDFVSINISKYLATAR